MPKETFNNLNADKKKKVFDAAVQEFSTRRFSEASINQIIKAAGIPRGSFYQYFSGKEDLFLYMSAEIAKMQHALISPADAPGSDASVFDEFLYKARVSLELGRLKPEFKQISLLMEKDDSDFITGLRQLSSGDKQRVQTLFERDKHRGLIRPDVDSNIVIDMIFTLTLKEFFRAGMDGDEFMKRIKAYLQIIKDGIMPV